MLVCLYAWVYSCLLFCLFRGVGLLMAGMSTVLWAFLVALLIRFVSCFLTLPTFVRLMLHVLQPAKEWVSPHSHVVCCQGWLAVDQPQFSYIPLILVLHGLAPLCGGANLISSTTNLWWLKCWKWTPNDNTRSEVQRRNSRCQNLFTRGKTPGLSTRGKFELARRC